MAHTQSPNRKPCQQGTFDGLCGVYAILNSIKWLYRLDEADLEAMFQHLCEALPGKFPKVLWDGLGVPDIRHLLDTSATYLSEKHGYEGFCWRLPFLRRHFASVDAFWRCVEEQFLDRVPAVVIIGLNKPWDHWTVAHKVTPRAVEFFDSWGMRRYPFTSFTLDKTKAGEEPGQKIMIDVHQTFRLSRGD